MGDPFAVASSAISVVSLGLQVCQGLTSYYGSWKDYDRDIDSFYCHLEGLSRNLQLLQTCLSNQAFTPAFQGQVGKDVLACKTEIDGLEKELAKIRSVALPSGVRDRLRSHLRRAQYPFKEAALMKLKGTVMGLQENVQLIVGVLNL